MSDTPKRRASVLLPIGVVLLVIGGFVLTFALGRWASEVHGGPIYFVGERVQLPAGVKAARCSTAPGPCTVQEGSDVGETSATLSISFGSRGKHVVELQRESGATPVPVTLGVVPMWVTFPACLALLVLVFAGPSVLRAIVGRPDMTWAYLLSEPNGGYSLAKMQLAVWWLPAIIIVGGVFAVKLEHTVVPPTFAVLLGLAGATTALGAATSPNSAFGRSSLQLVPVKEFPRPHSKYTLAGGVGERAATKDEFTDLVSDWQNQGDFSRYQYLLLAAIGSCVVTVAFFLDGRLIDIPKEFLALVGASQATYLGTKAVKFAKAGTEGRPTSLAA